MKTFNNELTIQRGESFTIDKLIENKDGSPFIISNRLLNPYFLLTISDSKYAQSSRYVKNYWLNLDKFPKFLSTQAVDLTSIKVSATSNESKYSDFPDGLIEGYVDGVYVQYDNHDDAVFYLRDATGKKVYKYFNTITDSTGEPIGWTNYKCRLIKLFSTEDTAELVGEEYVYSIRLVAGATMLAYLQNLYTEHGLEYSLDDSVQMLYDKLPEELKIVDITRPLGKFELCVPILQPTKLSVLSNIQGDM